jgi:hypothetical protein
MSSEVPEKTKNEIAEAVFTERKIEAIKLYRDATGEGLAEAKEFIEKLTDELREKSPEKFKPLTSDTAAGCGSSSLFFLAVTSATSYLLTRFLG